jgi:ABC-type multidrug transport system ATPase subunit
VALEAPLRRLTVVKGRASCQHDSVKIGLQNVSKSFHPLQALKDVTLTLDPGRIVAVLGSNGAGKTTLLRCLAGLLQPTRGRIIFDGEPFLRDNLDQRRRFAFLPDTPFFFPEMTAIRHVGMVLKLYGKDKPGVEETVVELLRDFDLLTVSEMPLAFLSRGQLYKAGLTALMAADPELWLLDEPFASGMDPHGLSVLKRRLRDAADRGRTILFSTQILEVAEHFSDLVCVIHRGELRAFDTIAGLRSQLGDRDSILEELFRQLREEDA